MQKYLAGNFPKFDLGGLRVRNGKSPTTPSILRLKHFAINNTNVFQSGYCIIKICVFLKKSSVSKKEWQTSY